VSVIPRSASCPERSKAFVTMNNTLRQMIGIDEARKFIKFSGHLQPREVGRGYRPTERSVVGLSATQKRLSVS
jgi:hypothetical protein